MGKNAGIYIAQQIKAKQSPFADPSRRHAIFKAFHLLGEDALAALPLLRAAVDEKGQDLCNETNLRTCRHLLNLLSRIGAKDSSAKNELLDDVFALVGRDGGENLVSDAVFAIHRLVEDCDQDAKGSLNSRLESPNLAQRVTAALALTRSCPNADRAAATGIIVHSLKAHRDLELPVHILEHLSSLEEIPDAYRRPLIAYLDHSERIVRGLASNCLGQFQSTEARQTLIEAYDTGNQDQKIQALNALERHVRRMNLSERRDFIERQSGLMRSILKTGGDIGWVGVEILHLAPERANNLFRQELRHFLNEAENATGASLDDVLRIPQEKQIVIISLLPYPKGDETVNESVTLKNLSNEPVDITGMYLRNRTSDRWELSGQLKPGEKKTIKRQNRPMTLHNAGDTISLFGEHGHQIFDEVAYDAVEQGEHVRR